MNRKPDGVFSIVRNQEDQERIVLVKHAYGSKFWSLPGGGKQDDETIWEACIRETREETGLDTELLKELGIFRSRINRGQKSHLFVSMPLSLDQAISISDPKEIEAVSWFSLSDFPENLPEDIYPAQRIFISAYYLHHISENNLAIPILDWLRIPLDNKDLEETTELFQVNRSPIVCF